MDTPDTSSKAREVAQLRRIAGLMCLWRLCGNAACRRASACRGRPRACAMRNAAALPPEVRGFFEAFVAAKACGVAFEDFQEKMAGSGEAEAYFAWAAAARTRRPSRSCEINVTRRKMQPKLAKGISIAALRRP